MYALVDCNNFYASCERLFQPQLAGRPIVVLSNGDGCVVARSAEAKALGIAMGAVWFKEEPQYPRGLVRVFSSNYELYGDISRRVMMALSEFAYEIEQYSIDEAFLRFPGEAEWEALGRAIRTAIGTRIGIPVSVGFAPTKVLAKAANKQAKREPSANGVAVLQNSNTDAALAVMNTSDLWGIGNRFAARLTQVGIHSALQLKAMPDDLAREILSVVGLRIVWELRGKDCIDVDDIDAPKKMICCARGFGSLLETEEDIREALVNYVALCAEKLRRQQSVAGHIQVFVSTNSFNRMDPQYSNGCGSTLLTPTDFTPELSTAAAALLHRIYRRGFRYKRVGVILSEFSLKTEVQTSFSGPAPELMDRRRRLMATMDRLNSEFGRNAVKTASSGTATPVWAIRRARKSPSYTTRWAELPQALA